MEQSSHRPVESLKTDESLRETVIPAPYCDRLLEIARERETRGCEWPRDRCDGLPMNTGGN